MAPAIARQVLRFGLLVSLLVPAGCLNRSVVVESPRTSGAQVPLTILRAGDQALAFVPVYIDGQGPFAFALDTGASHSLIEKRLADRLGLPTDNRAVRLSGITAVATGRQVWVGRWKVGEVALPARLLVTLDLNQNDTESGMQGLLGSDVLSQFGRVTIDYKNGTLTLGGGPG